MATPTKRDDDVEKRGAEGNPTDYSATNAPENQEHVESKQKGTHEPFKVPVEVGMEALHRETVPSMAADPGVSDYGSKPAKERDGTGRE